VQAIQEAAQGLPRSRAGCAVLTGQPILNVGSWAKLDAGSAAASFENSAYHHFGVAYGAAAPHTDKGDETDVRVCFSFCASVNAGFSPPAWHAGATEQDCVAGVVGHIAPMGV
jgi:hypothetical protein